MNAGRVDSGCYLLCKEMGCVMRGQLIGLLGAGDFSCLRGLDKKLLGFYKGWEF